MAALPLVTPKDDGSLEVGQDAASLLASLRGPLCVVAFTGKYRTGKSYILNKLTNFDATEAAFAVSSETQACTKGIWLWDKPISVETPTHAQPVNVVILDTEGLGAATATQEHDARIFALSVLLCSVLVFNSKDAITEDAIRMLSFVTKLSSHIQMDATVDSDATDTASGAGFLPSFVWLIRDFGLELVDEDGDVITADEYLENSLAPSAAGAATGGNKTREAIKAYFHSRSCVPLVRPASSEAVLQRLEHAAPGELRSEFVAGLCNLRWRLLGISPSQSEAGVCDAAQLQLQPEHQAEFCRVKSMHGTQLDGPMLLELLQQYVSTVNNGAVPSLGSAWGSVSRATCERAAKAASEKLLAWLAQLQAPPTPADATAAAGTDEDQEGAGSLPCLPSRLHRAVVRRRHDAMSGFRQGVDSLAATAGVDTAQLVWGSEQHPSLPEMSEGGSVVPQLLFPQYAADGHTYLLAAVRTQYEADAAQAGIRGSVLDDTVYTSDCRISEELPALPGKLPEDTAACVRACMQFVSDTAAWVAREAFRSNVKASHAACKRSVNAQLGLFANAGNDTGVGSDVTPLDIPTALQDAQSAVVRALQGQVDPLILAAHTSAMAQELLPRAALAQQRQRDAALERVRQAGELAVSAHARSQESATQSHAALQERVTAARLASDESAAQLAQARAKLEALQEREAKLQGEVQAAAAAATAQDDTRIRQLRQELWEAEQELPPGAEAPGERPPRADDAAAAAAGDAGDAEGASAAPAARKPQILAIKRVETPPGRVVPPALPARTRSPETADAADGTEGK